MLRVILSGLRAHKARLARTAIAVVMGVAFVAGTYVFTDTLDRMFDGIVDQSTQGVDVYIRSNADFVNVGMSGNRQPVPQTVVDRVRGVDGVRMANGYVQGMAALIDRNGDPVRTGGGPMLGGSWQPSPTSAIRLERGVVPSGRDQVALDTGTSSRFGFDVGDRIRIVTGGPVGEFRVVGVVRFGRDQNLGGATMALFDLRTAQELYHRVGEVDGVEVVGDPGIRPTDLAARIQPVLPLGVEAVTSATVAQEGHDVFGYYMGFFSTALLVFALIAMFVGAFLIFNTFTIIVAQQTREYGLLRALGASPRQVTASVMAEAGVVGVLASALGVGVGLLVARGLQALLLAFGMNLPAGGLVFQARTLDCGHGDGDRRDDAVGAAPGPEGRPDPADRGHAADDGARPVDPGPRDRRGRAPGGRRSAGRGGPVRRRLDRHRMGRRRRDPGVRRGSAWRAPRWPGRSRRSSRCPSAPSPASPGASPARTPSGTPAGPRPRRPR